MAGGVAAGGQLTTTTDVENYPGFPTGVGGIELTDLYRQQSINCGARIETLTVDRVDLRERPFAVFAGDRSVRARTLIVATGATAKRLDAPGAERLWQKGISACAVCDGALPVFRDKPLVVIGGGDTACEESLFLTRYGSSVTMLVRRDVLRASKTMQQRVLANDKIRIAWQTELVEVLGEQLVSGLRVRDNASGSEREIEAGGLFFAIGHQPNTAFLEGQLDTDGAGYVLTAAHSTVTSVPGVVRVRGRPGQGLPPSGHGGRHRLHGRPGGRALPGRTRLKPSAACRCQWRSSAEPWHGAASTGSACCASRAPATRRW